MNTNKTNTKKCVNYCKRMIAIKKELAALREEWKQMDLTALDKEEDKYFSKFIVQSFINNIHCAEQALSGK